MRKTPVAARQKPERVNVALKAGEEVQLYQDLKALASMHGLTIREVIVPALREALTRLQQRPLPQDTVLRVTNKKKEKERPL